jgi:predicted secreted hydrolase
MRRIGALLAMAALMGAGDTHFAPVRPGVALTFPRDHGAHPDHRTEWWYVTGWLDGPGGSHRGFQITFFRTATGIGGQSAFAPRQILFAHAALSDPAIDHLLHGERIARDGFGLAQASARDTDVAIDDWHLRRLPDGRFIAHVAGQGFALDLAFRPTQPVLAQGDHGFSRKGPDPQSASRYYSLPHLAVSGMVEQGGRRQNVGGSAWLDREWSSSYLPQGAVGWDWTGLNFDDGGALMAFRIRRRDGGTVWAGGSYRAGDGTLSVLKPGDVDFTARHHWRSPHTGALYPVDPVVRAGGRSLPLTPLFPDQELDGRSAGSPVYWEGAVRVPGGRGYLELTGYADDLHL